MRKKSIFLMVVTVVALLLAFTLTACNNNDGEDNQDEVSNDIYSQLNGMMDRVGYPLRLTTKTKEDGYTFNGSYKVTETNGVCSVEYSYEKLSTFQITEQGTIVAPEAFKTKYTGDIKVKDGKIIEQNGAEVNLPVEAFSVRGMALSEGALANVQTKEGTFSADITAFQTVTGMDINVTDAKIEIEYNAAGIDKITLTYSTSSYQSGISYKFI